MSGSGKSSLAFDTIYAEGQRRYVESLSAYARQFLERIEKPDVDTIDGIAPAVAIRQKNTTRNPRSTVATATEIYDYLRLLFARVGRTYCANCGKEVKKDTGSTRSRITFSRWIRKLGCRGYSHCSGMRRRFKTQPRRHRAAEVPSPPPLGRQHRVRVPQKQRRMEMA